MSDIIKKTIDPNEALAAISRLETLGDTFIYEETAKEIAGVFNFKPDLSPIGSWTSRESKGKGKLGKLTYALALEIIDKTDVKKPIYQDSNSWQLKFACENLNEHYLAILEQEA